MHFKRRSILAAALILSVGMLAGCGGSDKKSSSKKDKKDRNDTPVTMEEAKENSKDALENLLEDEPSYKLALAKVMIERINEYGRPCFTGEDIYNVSGAGFFKAIDLDGDEKEELVNIQKIKSDEGYYEWIMSIWTSKGSEAELIYEGNPHLMGVDSVGLSLLKDENGDPCFFYDRDGSMNGKYVGKIKDGEFEKITEVDYSDDDSYKYDYEAEKYIINGKSFKGDTTYTAIFYAYGEDKTALNEWEKDILAQYDEALAAFGVAKEGAAVSYTPGMLALSDSDYLRTRVTHVKADDGEVVVYDYDYDELGREIRQYRNNVMIEEHTYNDKGVLVREISYYNNGYVSEDSTYDDDGNLLDKMTYTAKGRENWHYVYTYDDKGRMATANMGIGGLKKYYYNDDDVMIRVDTVDEKTGEIQVYHEFELDDKGRQSKDYLYKDGHKYLFSSWTYDGDNRTQTDYFYTTYGNDGIELSLDGREVKALETTYDPNDNILLQNEYMITEDLKSSLTKTTEKEYDKNGNMTKATVKTYTNGNLSYDEETVCVYADSDDQLKKREKHFHYYGNISYLGDEEHDLKYTDFDSRYNDEGYKTYVIINNSENPFKDTSAAKEEEMYLLYQNNKGQIMGEDFKG